MKCYCFLHVNNDHDAYIHEMRGTVDFQNIIIWLFNGYLSFQTNYEADTISGWEFYDNYAIMNLILSNPT